MRDALSRRSGDGAPEPPPTTGPSTPPRPAPPPPHRPQRPTAPGGDSGGPSRPTPAPQRPQRPLASHPGDALGRPRNNPPDEEDPPEQTATTTFTLHAIQNHPLNNLLFILFYRRIMNLDHVDSQAYDKEVCRRTSASASDPIILRALAYTRSARSAASWALCARTRSAT